MVQNSAVSRTAAGKHLILVVDDELVNREILKMILEQEYDTLTAQDGESALDIIRENSERLSLILLDLLMPGIACGLSEWRPGLDNRFEAVFDRADNAMYEDKKRRKKEAEQA